MDMQNLELEDQMKYTQVGLINCNRSQFTVIGSRLKKQRVESNIQNASIVA